MLDTLTRQNIRDFSQRYAGTYGYLINPDLDTEKLLVQISGIENFKVLFKDAEDRDMFAYADSGIKFEFIPVTKGWKESGNKLYLLSRLPMRQWRRGICNDNTQIFEYSKYLNKMTGSEENLFNFLENQSDKNYISEFLEDKNPFCILSKHFAILETKDVYFYNRNIGKYYPDEKKIKLSENLVYQELNDLLRRENIPLLLED